MISDEVYAKLIGQTDAELASDHPQLVGTPADTEELDAVLAVDGDEQDDGALDRQ